MKRNKRFMAVVMAAVLFFSVITPMSMMADEGLVSVGDLNVNSLVEPLGVDGAKPVFSWILDSSERDKAQSAYQIVVSTDLEKAEAGIGDVWDSGKQSGENNYDVAYKGPALASKTKYYWAVNVWDEDGKETGFSNVSCFETGMIGGSGWSADAKWITIPKIVEAIDMNFSGAQWICRKDRSNPNEAPGDLPQGTQWFRKSFTIDQSKTVRKVYIAITADDEYEFFLNGQLAGANSGPDAWRTGYMYDITDRVDLTGKNVIAAWDYNTSIGYAGFLAKIEIRYTDNTKDTIVTNNTWKVSKTEVSGWTGVNFDDSSWLAPDQCVTYGGSPWGNNVIPQTYADQSRAAFMFRKDFNAPENIQKARVYISGLGMYDLSINGQRVAPDTVLNQGNTQYNKTVPYGVYDVTNMINSGENAIGVELGNGFWNESDGAWNWGNASWRTDPKLLLQLEITDNDGNVSTVVSDTSWDSTNTGPTVKNSIYYGESYDARNEKTGWDSSGYENDGTWVKAVSTSTPAGKLQWQYIEPVRRTYTYQPMSITKMPNGSYVLRSPEMVTGWVKLTMKDLPAGNQVVITYGETINAQGYLNSIYTDWFPKDYIQRDYYTAKGAPVEVFEPKFSYKGYEYIQIDNYPGELTADDVELYRCNNDVATSSNFETSNEMVNYLHRIMRVTLLNNFQFKPTDTPVWEKNGWTGDANVALPSMLYNFDINSFLMYYDEMLGDTQKANGDVMVIAPSADWTQDDSPVWNSVYINIVEKLWDMYGNMSFVEKQYDSMRKLAVCYINYLNAHGNTWTGDKLGDWVSPGNDASASEGSAITATAYAYMALTSMEKMATALGKTADTAQYRAAMQNVYAAFNAKFYKSEGYYDTGEWYPEGTRTRYRQASQLVPLAAGLVPEEYKSLVLTNLVADIVNRDYHLDTGCVGTKEILPVLTEYGYADVAYKILNQTSYPSWGYFKTKDATSLWESWGDYTRSRDHYFLGTYEEYLYEYFGGLKNVSEGFKTFELSPLVVGDMEYADLDFNTVRGQLISNWRLITKDSIAYDVKIPFGSTATIYLPTGSLDNVTLDGGSVLNAVGVKSAVVEGGNVKIIVGSGSYSFVSKVDGYKFENTRLSNLIKTAEGYLQIDYKAEAWENLQALISRAKQILNDSDATIDQINAIANELEAMLLDMPNHVNVYRDELTTKLLQLQQLYLNPIEYLNSEWALYVQCFVYARDMANSITASDDELINAKAELEAAYSAMLQNKLPNLALNKPAIARTTIDTEHGWNISRVTNGDRKNVNQGGEYTGYSSTADSSVVFDDREEWIYVDLGSVMEFDYVTFYPAVQNPTQYNNAFGFPRRFTIDIASENPGNPDSWTTVNDDFKDEVYPVADYGPLNFYLGKQNARYVRLYALSLNPKPSDGNRRYLQLTEIEVYNTVELSDYTINATTSLVTGCDANFAINATGDFEGKTTSVVMFGKEWDVDLTSGYAVIKLSAADIPDAAPDHNVILKVNQKAVCNSYVTVVDQADIRAMDVSIDENHTYLKFSYPMSPSSRGMHVYLNGERFADGITFDEIDTIMLDYVAKPGDVFTVKGVKFSALFRSYSFSFTSEFN